MLKPPYSIILGSQSPRRKELLQGMDIPFSVRVIETDERYPQDIQAQDVPAFIAVEKGKAHISQLHKNELVITSDTVVICENEILGKPKDREQAITMLQKLSGKSHLVVTGVCLTTTQKTISFSDATTVYFKTLSEEIINYYVDTYKPYDKAGGYGIQEWIGYVGIAAIEGSYFNVMGLPVAKLFDALEAFNLSK